ncbi:MAG: hypothetical protein M3510_08305 [Actinomycetota bacterium]|nr:hypothetical protein [Actinomycetota bacterium]
MTGLPNGRYFIEMAGNPKHNLFESSTDNNVSSPQDPDRLASRGSVRPRFRR